MGYDDILAQVADLKLFTPGPTYVSRELMAVAAKMPNFSHRDEEIIVRFKPIYANLRKMAEVDDSYNVILMPGSGSTAMESSIVSLVGDDEKVLSISMGSFGDMYHDMTIVNRKNSEKLSFAPGQGIDLNALEDKIKEMESNGEKPSVVTFTHNETSTGVQVDVVAICNVIKKYGAIALVDAVSAFGATNTGIQDNVAMYSTATQKSMALDAGFGLAFVSEEALERAKYLKENKKCYPPSTLDLTKHAATAKGFMTGTTPNCTLINALFLQTDAIVNTEGVQARYDRHRAMKEMTHDWIDTLNNGCKLFPSKDVASSSVTGLQMPPGTKMQDFGPLKTKLRADKFVMSTGLPPMNKALEAKGEGVIMRIPHMGDMTKEMLQDYLDALKKYLLEM
ncbi:MAG: alanine--glyoxylate aminotransferase family protein [Chloroflexi bacterium]|jgi:aspartate aminotransferase-like enzyme|nr:alanine--glyoxylate aminotransferase family protein [Chloroflexota bacterium]MBT7079997.1 alanine--glyoxylate aminotransferase family protein [Chloroflexota bacterium]MBT7290566.1 alanine--glyoxylate aminotransferase family protein [Chloroflexota bacterium]